MSSFFDHVRRDDGEHVGCLEMVDDRFVPYDRLWVRRGEPMELHEAEDLLDRIGLSFLAEDWELLPEDPAAGQAARVRIVELTRDSVTVAPAVDGSIGEVALSVDPLATTTLPLPTARLRRA